MIPAILAALEAIGLEGAAGTAAGVGATGGAESAVAAMAASQQGERIGNAAGNSLAKYLQSLVQGQGQGPTGQNSGQGGSGNAGGLIGPTNSNILGQVKQQGPGLLAGPAIASAAMGASQLGGLNPIGLGIGAFGLAKGIDSATSALTRWGEALLDSKRELIAFSPAYAGAFAEAERRGVIRNIGSGERTGGTSAELSNSLQNLYDQIQPMRDSVTNVIAVILTKSIDILTAIATNVARLWEVAKMFPGVAQAIDAIDKRIAKAADPNAAGGVQLIDFMQRAMQPPPKVPRPPAPPKGRP